MDSEYVYGWKCLTPYGSTINDYGETFYVLPKLDQKWGDWMVHPNPAQFDGNDCGVGRYHIHKKPTFEYATEQAGRWLWYVRARKSNVLGESDEKYGATEIQLRRVSFKAFTRMIRWGWMRGANLYGANLYGADLQRANLCDADLQRADLRDADLYGANLQRAYLRDANLRDANLNGANLRDANLRDADLSGANLRGADLSDADLYGANLSDADLRYAIGYVKP